MKRQTDLFLVLFFCLLLHRLAVRIRLPKPGAYDGLLTRLKKYVQTLHHLPVFIIRHSSSITLEVSLRGRGSMTGTMHYTVPHRS